MTRIINFHGGPGVGKSTAAAYMFYQLKSSGHSVELVREFVKGWAWEKRSISHYDQFFLPAKQMQLESALYGKVDWLVTDSPVLLNVVMAERSSTRDISHSVQTTVHAFYEHAKQEGHHHTHVMLTRERPYQAEGRYQDETEARKIDEEIVHSLQCAQFPIVLCNSGEMALRELFYSITEPK